MLQLFLVSGAYGQEYTLDIQAADTASVDALNRLNYNSKPGGKLEANRELASVLQYFYEEGYITASIDSIYEDSAKTIAWLMSGKIYQLSGINKGNLSEFILNESGYKEKLYRDRPFNPGEIRVLAENILTYCENHGHPFASLKLDSVSIGPDNNISASINLQLNQKVSIDSIIIKGNSRIHRKFIRNYLNIKPGDVYNELKMSRIAGKINELPFVSVIRPHEVAFSEDKATLILYIDKQKASQFDGIIGIAPNEQTTGKLLLTGDVKLKLLSAFNRGELIDFNWKKLEAETQSLNFNFNFPFLFSTPFGVDYKLKLFKKDTSYLTLNNNIGIQVLFSGYNHVKAFYENQRSNLLSTNGLEFATTLPEYADINTSLYGAGIDFETYDYSYNPQRGFGLLMSGAIGTKEVKKNSNVNPALYDSIPLKSTLYRLELNVNYFIPLFRNNTLMLANKSGFLENNNLFDNELFRIGGLKTLRGFDEESISASLYSIFTLEYRFLFDRNSFFQLYIDGAYYERNANAGYYNDMPLGFGVGVNFETRAGIFALSYALGKSDGQSIEFRSAKIHFGLTAKF